MCWLRWFEEKVCVPMKRKCVTTSITRESQQGKNVNKIILFLSSSL